LPNGCVSDRENNLQYLPIEFSEDLTMVCNALFSFYRSLGIHLDRCCQLWNYFFMLSAESPHCVKNNAQLVTYNVKLRPNHLVHASDELKADKDFVKSICLQSGASLLSHASNSLRSDRDFVRQFFKPESSILLGVALELLQDRLFVLEALKKGSTLPHVPSHIMPLDDEIRTLANRWTMENASQEQLHNKEFVMKCLKCSPFSFGRVVDELKTDCEFIQQVLETICQGEPSGAMFLDPIGNMFQNLNEKQRASKELVLKAVPFSVQAYQLASEELKYDREVVLAVAKNGELALQSIPGEFKKDRQVVLTDVTHDSSALEMWILSF